jgi:cystathionine beta-lyase/cystathionine gamma-synthase
MTGSNNTRPLSPDIVTSTSFHTHPDAIGFSANDLQHDAPHFYTRWSNPTVAALEENSPNLKAVRQDFALPAAWQPFLRCS